VALYVVIGLLVGFLAFGIAQAVFGQAPSHYRHRDGWVLPDSLYTPGKVTLLDTQTVPSAHQHGTSHAESLKEHIRQEYGFLRIRRPDGGS